MKSNLRKLYLIIPIHRRKSLFNIDPASENTGVWQPELQDSQQGFSCQTCITQFQLFQYLCKRKMSFHRLRGAPRLPRRRPLSQKVPECARTQSPPLTFSSGWASPGTSLVLSSDSCQEPGSGCGCGTPATPSVNPDRLIAWVTQPNPINCLWNCNFMFRRALQSFQTQVPFSHGVLCQQERLEASWGRLLTPSLPLICPPTGPHFSPVVSSVVCSVTPEGDIQTVVVWHPTAPSGVSEVSSLWAALVEVIPGAIRVSIPSPRPFLLSPRCSQGLVSGTSFLGTLILQQSHLRAKQIFGLDPTRGAVAGVAQMQPGSLGPCCRLSGTFQSRCCVYGWARARSVPGAAALRWHPLVGQACGLPCLGTCLWSSLAPQSLGIFFFKC